MHKLVKSCSPKGSCEICYLDRQYKSAISIIIIVPTVQTLSVGLCALFAFGIITSLICPLPFKTHVGDIYLKIRVDGLATV